MNRTMKSSTRRAISRSCNRKWSAMPPRIRRASRLPMHCGSSERLPLVSTMGRSIRRSIRWCSGVFGSMTPNVPTPGATFSARVELSSSRRNDDNRGGGAAQDSRLLVGDAAEGPCDRNIADHHGEWLACAPLARPQTCHGRRVGRVAGELKSAEPLIARICPRISSVAAASMSSGETAVIPDEWTPIAAVPATRAVRMHDTRSAARGSVGRPACGIRRHTSSTKGTAASSWLAGRTGSLR